MNIDTIETRLDQLLIQNRATLGTLLDQSDALTWENFIMPQEAMADELHQFWSPISHLNAVMNSEPLRKVYNACLPKLSEYFTELGHHVKLYQAYQQLQSSASYQDFDIAQKKVIDDALRNFKLAGVGLNPEDKQTFKTLDLKLSELTTKFEENILDSTHAWTLLITDQQELSGLPEHAIQSAREKAIETSPNNSSPGFLLTLDFPCYHAVITYAHNAALRQKVYEAYVTRASEKFPLGNQYDNSTIIESILKIRLEMAHLLGFKNFAEKSLATKMANSAEVVLEFLDNLTQKAQKKSAQEFKCLVEFVKNNFHAFNINPWDLAYYAEKYRQSLFNFSEEDLRPYFPLEKVLAGMFTIIQNIYGMKVKEIKGIHAWHPDVRCLEITDATGTLRGRLFLDLFARAHKRNGAWMDSCKNRRQLSDGSIQYPEAYLTCNFSAPLKGQPSLLTHDEVVTLFHETGHCLHHVLTQVNYLDVAGIQGVEWDAVELPSQFFEKFCWEEESLALISSHYETNEPLPSLLKEKMLRAKNFHIGLHLTRQLTFALFDFQLHQQNPALKTSDVQALLNRLRDTISPFKTPEYNRFQHSFSHIFAGGYAAGYYSYLWAEVLAHDAFSAFKEAGIFNARIGRKFLHSILEKGGSRNAMELFMEFRGRAPTIHALLQSYEME